MTCQRRASRWIMRGDVERALPIERSLARAAYEALAR
jgi:hypothetical protein